MECNVSDKLYIDRTAAIMTAMNYDGNGNAQDASQDIASALSALPAADVRPVVHARWRANEKFETCESCTVCGCAVLKAQYDPILRFGGKYAYCPNCGAIMDRGE